jgi:hypothetical protein
MVRTTALVELGRAGAQSIASSRSLGGLAMSHSHVQVTIVGPIAA